MKTLKKSKNFSNSVTSIHKNKTFDTLFMSKNSEKNITQSDFVSKFKLNQNKKNCNSNGNISINSLYTLPFLNKSIEKKNKTKSVNNSRKKIKKIIKNFSCINSKDASELKIENYMKNKFYVDTERKMTRKLKCNNFCYDNSIKDQLIRINKIKLFWGGVFEYCNPIIRLKKYNYDKKNLFRQRLFKEKQNINNDFENNLIVKKNKKPNLYTYNFIEKLRTIEKNIRNNK